MDNSPGSWLLTLLLVVGATARLTRLVTADTITARLRAWAMKRAADPDAWLPTLLRCPWCFGMWVAWPVAVAGYLWHRDWWFIVPALALTASYATGYLGAKEQ